MKKIYILFAIIALFVVQFGVRNVVYAADENVDFTDESYSNLNTEKVSCGGGMVEHIPKSVVNTTNIAYNIIQVVVPIILIIMGMITLIRSVTAGKEDEIKKAQMAFVKKLIVGALVFFVFVIVKLLISVVADASDKGNIMKCANCFLNNKSCVTE